MDFLLKVIITIFFEEILVYIPLVLLFFYSIYSFAEKKNLFYNSLIITFPLLFIFYQYSFLPEFFSSIGQDSLSELNADFGEAIFYIKTFLTFLFDPEIFKRNRFWLLLISSLISAINIYYLIKYYLKKKNINILTLDKYFNFILFLTIVFSLYGTFSITKKSLDIGKKMKVFETEFKKNILKYDVKRKSVKPLNTIIYIGESTSALNLSIYGYPFNTTPWLKSLEKDNKLLKFNKVFATHTHTTPSLLSAFSLCIGQSEKECSLILDEKNNLPIIDVLNKSDIDTFLFSTQGSLGGHNLANKLVFNTKKTFFASEDEKNNNSKKFLGNRNMPKLKDHEFFLKSFCNKDDLFNNGKSSLSLLHSYAGHGQYNGYLNHAKFDNKFSYPNYINQKNFLGKDFKNFKLLQEYDTVIKYIDDTVNKVFNCSNSIFKKKSEPMIFIYFSDHGESPATARGHDSSRLTYEMLHVPLIVYFNQEAYELYNSKFEELNKLKDKNLTLKFISDLILDLYDVDVLNNINKEIVYESNKYKSLSSDYLLDRKDLKGKISKIQTFWNYKKNIIENKSLENSFLKQDTSISLWQLQNFLENKKLSNKENIKNLVCKHRANSFITQYKASLSNGCFETDVFFFKDQAISTHEIISSTKLIFNDFVKSNFRDNTVWLDSKNVNKLKNCQFALSWMKKNSKNFASLLVEVPEISIKNINNQKWKDCIEKINSISNVEVGYYMPTNLISDCSIKNNNNKKKIECEDDFLKILKFLKQTKIEAITFDYSGYQAIKDQKNFKNFKWHIWHVDSLNSFNKILSNDNIGIILLKNNKFSNNLN